MNVAYLDITGRETVRKNSLPWIIQILLMSILLIMWTGTSVLVQRELEFLSV